MNMQLNFKMNQPFHHFLNREILLSVLFILCSGFSSADAETVAGEIPDTSVTDLSRIDAGNSGTIGFDSSTFFYNSSTRGSSSTSVEAEVHGSFDHRFIHGQADAQLYTFISADNPQTGYESKELYLSTQKGLIEGEVTVGRRVFEWSKVDQNWKMMSLWSPRFTWDELHPETIGMTGVFYSHESDHFKILAFGSPIAIPERGTPVYEDNHNIVSPNPLFRPLPTSLNVMNKATPVEYTLLTPPLQQILLRPNFALKGTYEVGNGFWGSLGDGVLPVNQIQMAAEPYVDASSSGDGALTVNIRPQFPMRNIVTAEAGYDAPKKDWSLWTSASYEQPFNFENQSTWLNPIITPTTIFSAGTNVQLTSNFWFTGAALFIHEQPFVRSSDLPDVNVSLPSRFPLKQAIKLGGSWIFNDKTQGNFEWTQDLIQQTHMISADIQHAFKKNNILVGLGTDIMITDTTQGWVGQYYGDDRLRGWLKYAF